MQTQPDYSDDPMPTDPNNADGTLFLSWLKAMKWDRHGGVARAADALGKSPMQVSRYKDGANLPKDTLLAMAAIADDIEPWGETSEILSISLKLGRKKKRT